MVKSNEKIIQGKVREVYEISDKELVVVTTDRLRVRRDSADAGAGKGHRAQQASSFWFNLTKDIVPNHMISEDPGRYAGGVPKAGIRGPHDPRQEAEDAAV